jgi:hypothetical protein
MGFVNTDIVGLWGARIFKDVFLARRRVPETGIIDGRYAQILRDTFDPSRQAFNAVAIWEYH